MANLSKPNLGFSPNRGRSTLDRLTEEATFRIKQVSTSRPFVAFAAVAVMVLGVYFFLIAAPIFVSQSSFAVRGREQAQAAAGLLAGLGGGADTSGMETAELKQFISSPEMLQRLDQKFHLRDIYSRPRIDLLNWMPRNASREQFLDFYRKMVSVNVEQSTNILSIETHSFDAVSAQQLAEAILEISADYLDGLSAVVRRDTLRASEQELGKAEDAVRTARLAMTKYRTTTGMLDPAATASAQSAAVLGLQQEVLAARADLASLATYSTPHAPQVVQLKARIAALEEQISQSQSEIATGKRSDTLAQKLYQYEGLLVNNDYAEKQLVAAMAANDTAKTLAGQRERFLVRITNPNLPEEAALPHRLLSFIEALIVLLAAYGIVALAIAGVRDHQGI